MDNSIIKATETITTSTAPAMPAEASPRPWRVERSPANSNFWVVRCDNGVSVATAWHEADAAVIVEAVNERDSLREELYITRSELRIAVHRDEQAGKACRKWDEEYRAIFEERERLRDLVRRLVHQFEGRATYDDDAAIIRKAREAIGEDAP